MNTYCRFLIIA